VSQAWLGTKKGEPYTAVKGAFLKIQDQLDRIIQAHGWDLDTAAGRAGLESYLQEPAEE
jgi:hypothetical protein